MLLTDTFEAFEILACPLCKRQLIYSAEKQELLCRFDHLVYPIEEGIPKLYIDKARKTQL
jgi:uncharacterized protein YbaR (Trm112 family)